MNMLLAEIKAAAVAVGSLRFWWLGQQSWIVKTARYTFFIDPYLTPKAKRNTPPLFTPAEMTNADFILCTHDHSDHLDRPSIGGMVAASAQAVLLVPQAAAATLPNDGVPAERINTLNGAGDCHWSRDGVRITALPAKHESFSYSAEFGYPFLQYVIETDGVRIYTAGDTLLYDGMLGRLRQWQRFTLALVPINGRDAARFSRGCLGNMTWQEAADLCGELRPELACPGHYEMFSDNSEDPQKFLDYCSVKYPQLSCWTGAPGTGDVVLS